MFDEAHMLKNMSSQRYTHLMRIKVTKTWVWLNVPGCGLIVTVLVHTCEGQEEIVAHWNSVAE